MKKKPFYLTNKIDNLENLPLETLVTLQKLYEDNNLPENIKVFFAQEGFNSEKLSQLINKYQTNKTQEKDTKNYVGKTFIHHEEGRSVVTDRKRTLRLKCLL